MEVPKCVRHVVGIDSLIAVGVRPRFQECNTLAHVNSHFSSTREALVNTKLVTQRVAIDHWLDDHHFVEQHDALIYDDLRDQ